MRKIASTIYERTYDPKKADRRAAGDLPYSREAV